MHLIFVNDSKVLQILKISLKIDLQNFAQENWMFTQKIVDRKLIVVEILISNIRQMDELNPCCNIYANNCFQLKQFH